MIQILFLGYGLYALFTARYFLPYQRVAMYGQARAAGLVLALMFPVQLLVGVIIAIVANMTMGGRAASNFLHSSEFQGEATGLSWLVL